MSNRHVQLRPHNFIPYTLVPNFFIDQCLAKTNGEFIKVYLVLLRYMSVGQLDFDLSQIADLLLMTESDVLRALNFFQSEKLLTLVYENNALQEIHLNHMDPSAPDYRPTLGDEAYSYHTGQRDGSFGDPNSTIQTPTSSSAGASSEMPRNSAPHEETETAPSLRVIRSKPEYTVQELSRFVEEDEMKQLIYMVQKYLGKTLSSQEMQMIVSFHDWLGLPIDVIELLIEYCVENDHRHMRYIEKVAIDWSESGINTVEKAKTRTETYNKSYFTILRAYGITDRSPTPGQIKLMDKWLATYNMEMDVIAEACHRTIMQINKAEMRYTESILNAWHQAGVHIMKDVDALDTQFNQNSTKEKPASGKSNTPKSSSKKPNQFTNYDQRTYDFDALEKRALELRLKEFDGKRYSS